MLADVAVGTTPPSTCWEAPPALNQPHSVASISTLSNVFKRN